MKQLYSEKSSMSLRKNTNASRETSPKDQSFSCKVPLKDRRLNRLGFPELTESVKMSNKTATLGKQLNDQGAPISHGRRLPIISKEDYIKTRSAKIQDASFVSRQQPRALTKTEV
jgi:hypothetical protein